MPVESLHLDPAHCRARQQRLCERLAALSVDWAVLVSHENVQYLTGFRPHRLMQAAVCVEAEGRCTLAAPNSEPDNIAADRVVTFEAQWHSTLRQEQLEVAIRTLVDAIGRNSQRLGIEFSNGTAHVLKAFDVPDVSGGRLVDIDPVLWELRRRKDPDELALIRRAIDCT